MDITDTEDTVPVGGGKLMICATPIGNLGDITERVIDALRESDVVCAEDTRVTGRLLAAYGISKRLERLDETRIGLCADRIIERVCAGERIAYCTDAGMPGISDPGLRLIAAARVAGVPVEVMPGVSAASMAYVISGFTNPHYYFGGFFPRKEHEQESLLNSLHALDAVLLFYESPKRAVASLKTIARVFDSREVAVCRELTKLHEEVIRGCAPEVYDKMCAREAQDSLKGEIVIVIDAPSESEIRDELAQTHADAREHAAKLVAEGLRTKEVAARLAGEFDLDRNDAYDIALQAQHSGV